MKLEESFAFYKSIYERELKRRFDLDGLNTQMLTVASFALALIYFLFKQIKINSNIWYDNILIMLSIIGFISWLISIYFIAKASNNLLNGFSYIELPNANGLRNHELKFTDDHSKNKELLKFNTFTEYLNF